MTELQTKQIKSTLEKGERDGQWIMGATSLDRDKDTISAEAFTEAIKSIKGRLITLWAHKSDAPCGYWENIHFKAGKLIGDLQIADTNLGKMIKQLLADGVPLGASIGFRGAGAPNDKGGIAFETIELLETSLVAVGANRDAMQIAKNFGIDIQSSDGDPIESESGPSSSVTSEAVIKAKSAILRANQTLRKTL